MFNSYEAIYNDGQIQWLTDCPKIKTAKVLVTVLEETTSKTSIKRRVAPASIAGKGKTLGDIVSPIVDEDDWQKLALQSFWDDEEEVEYTLADAKEVYKR